VAERLRRETRNLLGSPRAGSNPAECGNFLFLSDTFSLEVLLIKHDSF